MTGLDKIVARIKLDTDNAVNSISTKNKAECEKVLSEAKKKADAILCEGNTDSEKICKDIIARADSAAELKKRQILLETKQNIMSQMIEKALKYLESLPDDKYFELIYKMISKYSENASGVISMSSRDLIRLPADFAVKVSSLSKGDLILSKTPALIDSGFVLTYGGVDVNCSFKSLFSDNSERISDTVAHLLFN